MPLPSLGRTKIGRHRTVEPPLQDPEAPDQELESYLAALAPEDALESTGSGRRFSNSEVYQLRLPLMANEQLRELANANGTSPQSLAQEWVIQRLTWECSQRTSR